MKIYKDFHNLSFPRHICRSFILVSNFIVLIHKYRPSFIVQNRKTSPSLLRNAGEVFLYSGIGSRIRSVNQPSAQ